MGDRSPPEQPREKHPLQIGEYRVGNILGKGGFGHVYKALHQQTAEFAAIKTMHVSALGSGDLALVEQEIALLSKLKHRNIVKYIDSIRNENHLHIVLELVEGGSLCSIVHKFGTLPEPLCSFYTSQILNGLSYLHAQGVIHRDIKGANVLTTKTGKVKLADFGVATKLSEVDMTKNLVVGTPYWMAPEIVESMSGPTPACDLWSVGSTVVEMYTGSPPYFHLPPLSAMFNIVSDVHPPLPDMISLHLQSFLMACWEKNPNNRAGATELLEHDWIKSHKRPIELRKSQAHRGRSVSTPAWREDEDEEEDAEAVETFIASATNSKELSQALLGRFSGSGRKSGSGSGGPGAGAATADRGTGSLTDRTGGVSDRPFGGHEEVADASSAMHVTMSMPNMERPRSVGTERRPLAPHRGSTEIAASGSKNHEQTGDGSTVRSSAGGADGVGPLRGESLGASGASPASATSRPLPPTTTLPSPVHAGPSHGSDAPSVGEYQFFFMEEAQRMDQQRLNSIQSSGEASSTALLEPAFGTESSPQSTGDSFRRSAGPTAEVSPKSPAQVPPAQQAAGQRDAAEIKQLLGQIRPFEEPEALVLICQRLTQLLQQEGNEERNMNVLLQNGAVPIAEMLQVADPALLREVLKIANQLAKGSEDAHETFATVGLIPGVIKFARSQDLPHLRREAATFISRLCKTSERSLHLLVACGGLEALADLVAYDYYNNRDLVWLALDSLDRIFQSASQNGRNNDFCRILAKHGLCGHLCMLIDTLAGDILVEKASGYLRVVVGLLLHFAKEGDAIVKVYMTKSIVLEGLLSSLEFLPLDLSVQIYKVFKQLAQEPSVLNMLENAGVVPALIANLSALTELEKDAQAMASNGSGDGCDAVHDASRQCLLSLFYLCKLSRPRQEQAALAGAVPTLKALVEREEAVPDKMSDTKQRAFVMLCDMTSASLATRRILWSQYGVELLVTCLNEPQLQTLALEALVGWAGIKEHRADWCSRLEGVLLSGDGDFVTRLLALFGAPHLEVFMKVLEQLLKLTRLSQLLSNALAGSGKFFQVIAQRLQPSGLQRAFTPRPNTENDELLVDTIAGDGYAAIQDDEAAGARKNLLRLLLQICQGQDLAQLATLCKRHDLTALLVDVVREEKQKQRMILCELAKQLLELLKKALSSQTSPT